MRIKSYLAKAELKLFNADISNLSELQLKNRSKAIENLSEYRKGKTFPKNDYFAEPTSVFTDRSGTICAVANLIHQSGHTDLVDVITRENNLISLGKEHTDLLDPWLEENGITYDEAAYVQVPYMAQPELIEKSRESGNNTFAIVMTVVFAVSTIVILGGTTIAIVLKRRKAKITQIF